MSGHRGPGLAKYELTGLIEELGRERDALAVALRALASDLEAMQAPLREDEGDPAAHDAERADYFGPFACYYDELQRTLCEGEGVRVCWPNARISLEEAKKVLEALA